MTSTPIVDDYELPEPVACECNTCGDWSKYNLDHNFKPPKGWREDDVKGYTCDFCLMIE